MVREMSFTAKTEEQAVLLACEKLNKTKEELVYEVSEQSKKGFLGIGATEAKITVKYEPTAREATEAFLKEFIENAKLDAKIECDDSVEGELHYSVSGEGLGVLIGHHGDVLESLQYLLSLVTNRHGDDFVRVTVDIENYREKREETLKNLARKTAGRVRRTGRSVTFEPMSAYERRIIHSAAQEIDGVTTHSIGNGDQRRVVMSPVGGERVREPKNNRPASQNENKPKVVYEYNPVREPKKIVKAKSIDDINLADVEDTEMVNL